MFSKNYVFLFLAFFISYLNASPWLEVNSDWDRKDLISLSKECNFNFRNFNHFPFSLGIIDMQLNEMYEDSDECKFKIKDFIKKKFLSAETKIGIQTKTDTLYFQNLGMRYYPENNIYFSHQGFKNKFYYKYKINFLENETNFDESYISYLHKNQIITIGKQQKWWSPSENNSLILSNSARPQAGISIKNFRPYRNEHWSSILFNNINYSVF